MSDLKTTLSEIRSLPQEQRPKRMLRLADDIDVEVLNGEVEALRAELLSLLDGGLGGGRTRLALGEFLARIGDPRVILPSDDAYWVTVPGEDDGPVVIGRFPVTNHEFLSFVEQGGYTDRALWTDEGWDWLQGCDDPWTVRAKAESARPFTIVNQPVVGVTFHEALAYARSVGARLPRVDERVWVIRGEERRPYPWGAPFGEGNANTMEEVLGRPCAVGLYVQDRTPEGVCDMAGNVAEWTGDSIEDGRDRLIHPGAWDQPSLASWAKALTMEAPEARWAGLGFRLGRDAT